eukprot:CAMPEP_0198145072 /NCGR_PEP_ID=MMETSP1443-20131203/20910_1 /TAXON_ID=186043 /ORGANISM="Entomoneis sp., Strain CCMP2396" /LENGTH=201 /DNA_ID=CAMNT_0043808595 /DNA_START=85 /DNA_END=690 /DNA_ORIENTATION=-
MAVLKMKINDKCSSAKKTNSDPVIDISQQGAASHSKRRKRRTKVRFASNEIVFPCTQHSDTPLSSGWYSGGDYNEMRAHFIEDSKMAARANKASDSVLLRTFKQCCKGEGTIDSALVEELHTCLQQFEFTGLERMVARKIFHDKQYRRCTLMETVLSIQERHNNDASRTGALRFACESVSFSSVLFAHQLALASMVTSAPR